MGDCTPADDQARNYWQNILHDCSKTRRSLRNGFGEARLARSDAVLEEAAGGEELSVEQGGTGGAADKVVGEQGEFYVEERAFTDAADDHGHAAAGVNVAAGLRAIFLVEHDDGIFQRGGERSQFGADFEGAQSFADFFE